MKLTNGDDITEIECLGVTGPQSTWFRFSIHHWNSSLSDESRKEIRNEIVRRVNAFDDLLLNLKSVRTALWSKGIVIDCVDKAIAAAEKGD